MGEGCKSSSFDPAGKRFVDDVTGLEVLCTKPGEGALLRIPTAGGPVETVADYGKRWIVERERRGLPVFAIDEHVLSALATGLPDCAGVALGIDRLLMLVTAARHIDEVIAFPTERA